MVEHVVDDIEHGVDGIGHVVEEGRGEHDNDEDRDVELLLVGGIFRKPSLIQSTTREYRFKNGYPKIISLP